MAKKTMEELNEMEQTAAAEPETGAPAGAQRSGSGGERKKEPADVELSANAGSGTEQASSDVEPVNKSGFWCYIGPNIKNSIKTGTVFRGTRADALAKLETLGAPAQCAALVVSGDELPEARIRVRKPGNSLNRAYKMLERKGE